ALDRWRPRDAAIRSVATTLAAEAHEPWRRLRYRVAHPGGVTHILSPSRLRRAPVAWRLRLGRDHAPSGPPASTLRARCWPRPDGRAGSVIVVLGLSARWSQRRESVSIQGIAARAVKTRDASAPTATSPVRRGHQARAATTARAAAGPPSVSAR